MEKYVSLFNQMMVAVTFAQAGDFEYADTVMEGTKQGQEPTSWTAAPVVGEVVSVGNCSK